MKVLVTGGAGFIGSHIVDYLLKDGYQVAVVDNLSTGERAWLPPSVALYTTSVDDIPGMRVVFNQERPDYVIHQAAQIKVPFSVQHPLTDCQTNIMGTLGILELSREFGVRKLVYPGSAACYGMPVRLPMDESHPIAPISPYGVSKYTAELYTKVYNDLYGLPTTVLRYANVYGPRQGTHGEGGVVSIFINHLLRGTVPIIEGEGVATRDYIYVTDIARANVSALTDGAGSVLNISTNTEVSVNQLLDLLCDLCGVTVRAEHGPARTGDIERSVMANGLAQEALGWRPLVALREGLAATIEWAQSRLTSND